MNTPARPGAIVVAAARAVALFLGGFSLLNLLGERLVTFFNANDWWVDLHWYPHRPRQLFVLAVAVTLLAYAFRPAMSWLRRRLTQILLVLLLVAVTLNILHFCVLVIRDTIHTGFPVPFTLGIAVALVFILTQIRRTDPPHLFADHPGSGVITFLGTLALCILGAPLAQMVCFGKTDYHRSADVIVVFGAHVHADGTLSDAAAERVQEAVRLYQAHLAPRIIMSGGPGDGSISEPEAMRAFAIHLGVPPEAITLDLRGLNTEATVHNTIQLTQDAPRILAVSHFYHLPRVKMAYQRAGREVYTVPVHSPYRLRGLPWFMAREIPALWAYYLDPLVPLLPRHQPSVGTAPSAAREQ